ncbi:hypothetical protein, partial [Streptomyces sp. ADI95-17]|uniref:hypothetical protein n=1 Tax=Streptomyces sp. ADI95-17 TaxID=1522759 RepID=UPI001F14D8B9
VAVAVAVAVVSGTSNADGASSKGKHRISTTASEKLFMGQSGMFLAPQNISDGYSTVTVEEVARQVLRDVTTVLSMTSGWPIRDTMLVLTLIKFRQRLLLSLVLGKWGDRRGVRLVEGVWLEWSRIRHTSPLWRCVINMA